MADQPLIDELREYTDVTVEQYSNLILSGMIDGIGVYASAASIWRRKAAKLAALVDTQESGSSRSMSQAYKQAIQQAEHFQKLADAEVIVVEQTSRPIVHRIERE